MQAWGNGRGGIDAEWERFHDAWKESYLQNGYYNQGPRLRARWGNGGTDMAGTAATVPAMAAERHGPGIRRPGNGGHGMADMAAVAEHGGHGHGNGTATTAATHGHDNGRAAITATRMSADARLPDSLARRRAVPILVCDVALDQPAVAVADPLQRQLVVGAAFHAVSLDRGDDDAAALHGGRVRSSPSSTSIFGVPMMFARSIFTSGISVSTSLRILRVRRVGAR